MVAVRIGNRVAGVSSRSIRILVESSVNLELTVVQINNVGPFAEEAVGKEGLGIDHVPEIVIVRKQVALGFS